MSENDYKEQLNLIREYEREKHADYNRKIHIGIRINILLPLLFLILSFINSDSKLVFLILWILTLFGIAFYLIYIEYSDYALQERMKEFGLKAEDAATDVLVGHKVSAASDAALDREDEIDDLISEKKQEIIDRIDNGRQTARDILESSRQVAADQIESGKQTAKELLEDSKQTALELLSRRAENAEAREDAQGTETGSIRTHTGSSDEAAQTGNTHEENGERNA